MASPPATQQAAATTPAEAVKPSGEAVQADNEGPDDLDVTDRHNWAAAKSGAKILAAHKEVRGQRRRTEESRGSCCLRGFEITLDKYTL